MKESLAIVGFNFNTTSIIYESFLLLEKSLDKEYDFFMFDNGSKEMPLTEDFNDTRITLICKPHNEGFTKGMEYLFDFFIENDEYKTVLVFTASTRFLLDVNYENELQLINRELYKSTRALGYISSAIIGLHAINSQNKQTYHSDSKIKTVWNNQTLATIYDLNFIQHCKRLRMAFYNQNLSYGWGVEMDLYLLAKSYGYVHGYFTSMPVYWIRNYTSV